MKTALLSVFEHLYGKTMTNAEQKLIEATRIRTLARRTYGSCNRIMKQAEADHSNANKAYRDACHSHSDALAAVEAEVLGEEA